MAVKTGGNPPRVKGYQFERDCVNHCKANGIEAKRTPCSKYPDLWINHRPVSCKRRKRLPKWIFEELARHDYILAREDRGKIIKISYWGPDK